MPSKYPILHNKPIDQWKVTELKDELKRRRLITRGLKEELVRRLSEAIQDEIEEKEMETEEEKVDLAGDTHHAIEDARIEESPGPLGTQETNKDVAEVVEKKVINLEHDSNVVDGNFNYSSPDPLVKDAVTTFDPNVAGQEVSPAVSSRNNLVESHVKQPQLESTEQELNNEKENELSVEKNDELNIEKKEEMSLENKEMGIDKNEQLDVEKNEDPATEKDMEIDNVKNEERAIGKNEEMNTVKSEETEIQKNEYVINEKDNDKSHDMDGKNGEAQHEMIEEKNDTKNKENIKDLEHLTGDVSPNKSQLNNQVSEVKSDFGFQVSYASISTASVSINEKNELKDNLNADNLDIGLVKPEMVCLSSSDVAPRGDDVHSLDNIQDPANNQGPVEVDIKNASCEDIGKKTDAVDEGYSEKLNLDRSSGDESMEEDVFENKQENADINLDVVEGMVAVGQSHVENFAQLPANIGAQTSENKDAIDLEHMPQPPNLSEKRKVKEKDSVVNNEPSKRQRRWNIETPKVPDQQITNLISSGTPKSLNQSTPKPSFSRTHSSVSEDSQKERTVPPSEKPPTNSLRIDRFLRPFTLKAVQELLGKTGKVCSFWMDNIKTHCFVTYASEEEAVQTRNAVYNLQWPPNGGRLLIAEFVDPDEVKMRLEAVPDSPAPVNPTPSAPQQKQPQSHPRQTGVRQQQPQPASHPLPPPVSDPPSREHLLPPPPSKKSEPTILTLDDLFMKTKATPRIYYLPLSEEQVASKTSAQVKSSRV